MIVSDPHNVAWAFNIRGSDVSYTPLPLAFAAVPKEGRPALYIDGRKLSNETRDYLETLADVREPAAFAEDLRTLGAAHATVRLDQATAADALSRVITEAGGEVVRGADPITLMKAVKNATEIAGTRAAHTRDGAAVANFLAWFDREAPGGKLTEIDAVAALESFRRDTGLLKDVSFPTISGTGPNGAIVHYRVTQATNRKIAPGDLFLIDSGAQYQDGTTDITRTIAVGAPTPEMRARFTRVLKATSRSRARCFRRASAARNSTRSRASICGKPASISTTAPGTASAATFRCTKARRASPSSGRRRCGAA